MDAVGRALARKPKPAEAPASNAPVKATSPAAVAGSRAAGDDWSRAMAAQLELQREEEQAVAAAAGSQTGAGAGAERRGKGAGDLADAAAEDARAENKSSECVGVGRAAV